MARDVAAPLMGYAGACALLVGGGAIVLTGSTATTAWVSAAGGRITVGGITYTIHSLIRMAPYGLIQKGNEICSRGVPPSVVENAIKYGSKMPGNMADTVVHVYENVTVVTNLTYDVVITVINTAH